MKPCGFIATYMFRDLNTWRGWKELPFNIPLFLYHLVFLIVGTAYGKIEWAWRWPNLADLIITLCYGSGFITIRTLTLNEWWGAPLIISWVFVIIAIARGIDWRRVWRAAQVSHVRLCLKKREDPSALPSKFRPIWPLEPDTYLYISFGWPEAKIENYWRMDMIDGKRFRYFAPTFEPSPEFIEAMIQYAEDQVGKRYDTLQLLSYGLNLFVWLFCWPWWGQEKLKWLNLRGGREVCSSGFTACLRWGERNHKYPEFTKLIPNLFMEWTKFFKGYDTAVVPPCLCPLSKNWEEGDAK